MAMDHPKSTLDQVMSHKESMNKLSLSEPPVSGPSPLIKSLIDTHPDIRPYLPGLSTCPRQWSSIDERTTPQVFEGVGGYVSSLSGDFYVHEIPKYFPSGEGEHTMALILKVGRTTEDAIQTLALGSGVSAQDIGYSGRKDKQALTTQWISLPTSPDQVCSLDEQVVILNKRPILRLPVLKLRQGLT